MTDRSSPAEDNARVRELVRSQFGPNAVNYATSAVHAKGASLTRLVELARPEPTWSLLDVATAAGHTAFAFAPHVREVVASDLLPEMLDVARAGAEERGLANVVFEVADAEAMPFEAGRFDAVTCRIAPHHFPDPARFVAESARVLKPGGVFGLVDNVISQEASAYVNAFEAKRDPSHVRALSMEEWLPMIEAAGLEVVEAETLAKRMHFRTWLDTMSVPDHLRGELLTELRDAPEAARTYLRPEGTGSDDVEDVAFHLTEGIVIARRSAGS